MAIPFDLTKKTDREALIKATYNSDHARRKAMSLRQVEIFNDRLHQFVWERLAARFSVETAGRMPIVSSINLARRIVKQEASLYNEAPYREYTDLSEDQEELIRMIRDDMNFNAKMNMSNESFKLQNQNHVLLVPREGKLMARVLRNHHLDKIDDDTDPEISAGYMISSFDKRNLINNRRDESDLSSGYKSQIRSDIDYTFDQQNNPLGDPEDYRIPDRITVFTDEYNFVMDKKGNIISGPEIENPIGMMPIVDISIEKDFEYWVRQGDAIAEFTIEYNVLMSDIHHIVQNQGYAQAFIVAKDDMMPQELVIGPNKVLRLPVDDSEVRPEFGFANPGSDIGGSIQFSNEFLLNFLTSRGLDPDVVATASNPASNVNSGIQEFLRMIKRFEATRSDMDLYAKAEKKLFKIMSAWHNAAIGNPNILDPMYVGSPIPESADCATHFHTPDMIQTENEKIDVMMKKLEMGLISRVEAIENMRGVDRDRAMEIAREIDAEQDLLGASEGQANGDIEQEQSGDEGLES